jgi:hypothetical protein
MIQKPLLWAEVGKVLECYTQIRVDFLSGCLVHFLWACQLACRSSTYPTRAVKQITPYHGAFLDSCLLIRTDISQGLSSAMAAQRKYPHQIHTGEPASSSLKQRCFGTFFFELELEPIQTHMVQKQLLWVKVGAHAVSRRQPESQGAMEWRRQE